MESLLGPLLPLFERERAAGRPVALGVLVETAGSTYRKPGALMLIASNGDSAGLLSVGCLEGDLSEYARGVIDTGQPRLVSYDMRGGDDLIWGLGLGCEGAMHILLMRVGPDNDWQPLTRLTRALAAHEPCSVDIAVQPGKVFTLNLSLPPKLLLLGAGPDAAPVVDFAARLNWKVTLVDHRPAYAEAAHFPAAERVVQASPDEIPLDLSRFSAAVVMSHHLPSDLKYLRTLAATSIPYIGLLGPAVRRERLLSDLGEDAHRIRGRLHAPVGLAIGGRSPESIALAIIAEIHAFVHNAPAANRSAAEGIPRSADGATGGNRTS